MNYGVNCLVTHNWIPHYTILEGVAPLELSAITPYQRITQALNSDPRCAQEVTLGRRIGLYRFCGDIGRGNFSRVKLAVHQLTRDKVAIKVVDRGRLDSRALRMLSREVVTLECVHHPNILRLFEVVETLGRVHLVTEWVRGGELYHRITQGGPLKELQAVLLYKQLLMAVKHMHDLGFVHRDIKAENVLLVTEEKIKLADFGFSTQLLNGPWQHLDTFCGSPPYAAPELFSDDHYIGGPVDVWALGVLLYFMVVGNMPFRAPTVPALRTAVLKGDYTISPVLSLLCCRLIQRILVHSPTRRPTIDQIISSQWVSHPNLIDSLVNKQQSSKTTVTKKPLLFFSTLSSSSLSTHNNEKSRRNIAQQAQSSSANNFQPILCSTKRGNSVILDDFLSPINLFEYNNNFGNQSNEMSANEKKSNKFNRRSIFSGQKSKKKIGPMEQPLQLNKTCLSTKKECESILSKTDIENKKLESINSMGNIRNPMKLNETKEHIITSSISLNSNNNILSTQSSETKLSISERCDSKILSDINNYDVETGDFIILPTKTLDVNTNLHLLEIEARKILLTLGITSEMLLNAIPNGPRSDLIGAYRIIVHRLQKQALLAKQTEAQQDDILLKSKRVRSCSIL